MNRYQILSRAMIVSLMALVFLAVSSVPVLAQSCCPSSGAKADCKKVCKPGEKCDKVCKPGDKCDKASNCLKSTTSAKASSSAKVTQANATVSTSSSKAACCPQDKGKCCPSGSTTNISAKGKPEKQKTKKTKGL